jgi:ATP-dependent Clp protease ATP-binding subunit ClpC
VTPGAKVLLGERGYDPTLGARPLRRAIQRLVEDPISERLLWKEFRAGQTIVVDVEPDPEDPTTQQVAFRAVEGYTPPPLEELAATTGE